MLHSHDVKSKEQVKGKRVLVVGAGNSAVDILSDAALDGVRAVHSMRRTYYFFPKMVFGKPTDMFIDYTSRCRCRARSCALLYRSACASLVGPHRRFGLERPDHDLFEAHPTACNTYLDHVMHGRIAVKPGIERLDGKTRHLHRRQRGGGRFSRLGHGVQAELPVHGPVHHSRRAGQARSCSSTPSTASSTICSWSGCSSRPKAGCGRSPTIRRG